MEIGNELAVMGDKVFLYEQVVEEAGDEWRNK